MKFWIIDIHKRISIMLMSITEWLISMIQLMSVIINIITSFLLAMPEANIVLPVFIDLFKSLFAYITNATD